MVSSKNIFDYQQIKMMALKESNWHSYCLNIIEIQDFRFFNPVFSVVKIEQKRRSKEDQKFGKLIFGICLGFRI